MTFQPWRSISRTLCGASSSLTGAFCPVLSNGEPRLLGLVIGVPLLHDPLPDLLVGFRWAVALGDEPLLHLFPQVGEIDLHMAVVLAGRARRALEDALDELVVDLGVPPEKGVHGAPVLDLLELVHLAPGRRGLPADGLVDRAR